MAEKTTIVYAKQELNGIMMRLDSHSVVRKAIEGHPILVTSGNDYINLYHVFERIAQANREFSKLVIVRKQIASARWLIRVVSDRHNAPEVKLEDGYDPKRGRYIRYAERLAADEVLEFKDKAEAIKARRAWHLYVPKETRRFLKSRVRKQGNKYVVRIAKR